VVVSSEFVVRNDDVDISVKKGDYRDVLFVHSSIIETQDGAIGISKCPGFRLSVDDIVPRIVQLRLA
jgi:hypothetical protein